LLNIRVGFIAAKLEAAGWNLKQKFKKSDIVRGNSTGV
jgi:hypothetical protein